MTMSDYSDLVARLRDYPVWTGDCHDAADALENQAKRISELQVALKPFADASDVHLGSDDMSIAFGITIKDLRQARKVLENA